MKNLFLEFEVSFIFHVILINFIQILFIYICNMYTYKDCETEKKNQKIDYKP